MITLGIVSILIVAFLLGYNIGYREGGDYWDK